MKRSVVIKRLGYEALRRLDNLRYMTRRLFIVSERRRRDLNDSYVDEGLLIRINPLITPNSPSAALSAAVMIKQTAAGRIRSGL